MSAFICDPEHLTALAVAAVYTQADRDILQEAREQWRRESGLGDSERLLAARAFFNILLRENYASVNARYSEKDEPIETLDRTLADRMGVNEIQTPHDAKRLPVIQLLKAIDCYMYQSCEHKEWEVSLARKICESIRATLITHLPGYDDAAWGFDASLVKAREGVSILSFARRS